MLINSYIKYMDISPVTSWRLGVTLIYGVVEMVNISSSNGLLHDGTKPLPESMLTYHQWGRHLRAISRDMFNTSILGMRLKSLILD